MLDTAKWSQAHQEGVDRSHQTAHKRWQVLQQKEETRIVTLSPHTKRALARIFLAVSLTAAASEALSWVGFTNFGPILIGGGQLTPSVAAPNVGEQGLPPKP
jgi:hypothetical protein